MTTTFRERADARHNQYGKHLRPHVARTSCVPEDLRERSVFVTLAAERQALFGARSRAVQAAGQWFASWNAAQDAAAGHVHKDVELALEAGTTLPAAPVEALVMPYDRTRVQWPYAELLTDAYWQWLHGCLEAEERARVIELGRDPVR